MPTGLRVRVEVTVDLVSCPGVWLRDRDEVYLSICLLGQHCYTRLLAPPIFPLHFNETFTFDRNYVGCFNPVEVGRQLEGEHVLFELIQGSLGGDKLLADFEQDAYTFMFPQPRLGPVYSSMPREVLMNPTEAFPGFAPKLEFSTSTVIGGIGSDTYQDDIYSGHYISPRQSRSLSRSASPLRRKLDELSLSQSVVSEKPFVVRKLDDSLIGRVPGSPTPSTKSTKKKKKPASLAGSFRSRSVSPSRLNRSVSPSRFATDPTWFDRYYYNYYPYYNSYDTDYWPYHSYDRYYNGYNGYNGYTGYDRYLDRYGYDQRYNGYNSLYSSTYNDYLHDVWKYNREHPENPIKVLRDPEYVSSTSPKPILESTALDDPLLSSNYRYYRSLSPYRYSPSSYLYSTGRARDISRRVDDAIRRSQSPVLYNDTMERLADDFERSRSRTGYLY